MKTSGARVHGRKRKRNPAFSLMELLVVLVILGVLSALLLSVVSSLRSEARTVECMNNVRQIGLAIQAYYTDHQCLPGENLKEDIASYLANGKVFVCPDDPVAYGDSYSQFYVAREDEDIRKLVIMCPRHKDHSFGATLFGVCRTAQSRLAALLWNGSPILAGDTIIGGENDEELELADGTTVIPSFDYAVMIMGSFYKKDGKV